MPSVERRDEIYRCALNLLGLRREATDDLLRRGLTEEQAQAAGYRSVPKKGAEQRAFIAAMLETFGEVPLRACPGFQDKNGRLTFWTAVGARDGYVVPYVDERGRVTGLQLKELGGKYITARGTQMASMYHVAGEPHEGDDLYVTEGATKANVAHSLAGLTVFAIPGQALQTQHVMAIAALRPGRVIVALDEEDNVNTDRARERWIASLYQDGQNVWRATWEGAHVRGPKGLDDLIASGGRPRLRAVSVTPSDISRRRDLRAVDTPGPIDRGESLAKLRAQTADAIKRFVRDGAPGEALLVSTPPGVGKTTALADALSECNMRARVVVGTTALARELAVDHGYGLIEGRNAGNCERIDVVDRLASDGFDIEELACGTEDAPRCPFRSGCRYYAQFDTLGMAVGAAEQLFNPRFLRGARLVVADDADLGRALVERTHLTVDVLGRAVRLLERRRRKAAQEVLKLAVHAVLAAPVRPLSGAAAWDHLVMTARRSGADLVELVRSLPERPTLPLPSGDEELRLDDIDQAPPASVLALLLALRAEVNVFGSGEDFNSRIRISANGIAVWKLRAPAKDRYGEPVLPTKALLVLEATPVASLVDHLTRHHERLPDIVGQVPLPANVTVVQYAGRPNGHTALDDTVRMGEVIAEIAGERARMPLPSEAEAAVCFLSNRQGLVDAGFAGDRVLTFGKARGTNVLEKVERLHVVGRPMPPGDDLYFLAQVIHHGQSVVSAQLVLEPRRFGGQKHEVDVVGFADERVAELLRAAREDEMTQVLHRARLLSVSEQGELLHGAGRRHVRLVLHTGHPVPGLRVDVLKVEADRRNLNDERHEDAAARVAGAVEQLEREGERVTVNAIAKLAAADKRTVTKALGTPVDTYRDLLNKGVHHVPQTSSSESLCSGGCGKRLPAGNQKCSDCAAEAAIAWGRRQRGIA